MPSGGVHPITPGEAPERLTSAPTRGADAIILDLDDAVAPGAKRTTPARTGSTRSAAFIRDSPYGVHDISKTEPDESGLPRFNMPLELGPFLGAKRFGGTDQGSKKALVLDREPYRYQTFISDIAGQDIHAHGGDVVALIGEVAT